MWKRLFTRPGTAPAYVTLVSGLPRSGTSMMMRMLEAGGLDILTDRRRTPDEDNPYGYYELEDVKKIKDSDDFLDRAEGKALKMVSVLLYDLPPHKRYKIIFMRRPLDEVLASQRIMLQRRGQPADTENDAEMARIFQKHLDDITAWLQQQPHLEVLDVSYHDVLDNPRAGAEKVNRFLDNRLDVAKMVAMVDRRLYRNRVS